jgi:hypothetical protein
MENYKSTYLERQKTYGSDKLRWEEAEEAEEVEAEEAEAKEAEAEENIRLKQYVSLHSKGRHNICRGNPIHLHSFLNIYFSLI